MGAAIPLRIDYDATMLRRLAKASSDGNQTRRFLALAEIYDSGSRGDAARIGGVGLQVVLLSRQARRACGRSASGPRQRVLRFNTHGPDGLIDRRAPGQRPKLDDAQHAALARIVEDGPVPAVHGVVRWRLKDLALWIFEEFDSRYRSASASNDPSSGIKFSNGTCVALVRPVTTSTFSTGPAFTENPPEMCT